MRALNIDNEITKGEAGGGVFCVGGGLSVVGFYPCKASKTNLIFCMLECSSKLRRASTRAINLKLQARHLVVGVSVLYLRNGYL